MAAAALADPAAPARSVPQRCGRGHPRRGHAEPAAAAPLPTIGSLLDSCNLAGFSEQLYVAHLGTDGWSRLSQYDSSATALAPAPARVVT